jgi:hypothetical protein
MIVTNTDTILALDTEQQWSEDDDPGLGCDGRAQEHGREPPHPPGADQVRGYRRKREAERVVEVLPRDGLIAPDPSGDDRGNSERDLPASF